MDGGLRGTPTMPARHGPPPLVLRVSSVLAVVFATLVGVSAAGAEEVRALEATFFFSAGCRVYLPRVRVQPGRQVHGD